MFGKKRKLEEQMKHTLEKLLERQGKCVSKFSAMEERDKSICTDLEQVMENTEAFTIHAQQNIELESDLLQHMDTYAKELNAALKDYEKLKEKVAQHNADVTELVEHNKHYTTPSKYLTEVPEVLRQKCQSYEKRLEGLTESSRNMSVMALSAAIEAGRMGEDGKKFVAISEELRQMALDYEKNTLKMQEELLESQEKVKELEDMINRLISLMKDGNKGTNHLLKKSLELEKSMTNTSMRDFTEDVARLRDKVVSARNVEEEISKLGKRNQIQLNDIQDEMKNQNTDIDELQSELTQMFEEAEENIS